MSVIVRPRLHQYAAVALSFYPMQSQGYGGLPKAAGSGVSGHDDMLYISVALSQAQSHGHIVSFKPSQSYKGNYKPFYNSSPTAKHCPRGR
jgi:hypothetical protein